MGQQGDNSDISHDTNIRKNELTGVTNIIKQGKRESDFHRNLKITHLKEGEGKIIDNCFSLMHDQVESEPGTKSDKERQ